MTESRPPGNANPPHPPATKRGADLRRFGAHPVFERLLSDISTFFINLPADRIDSEIKAAQRRVCEHLDIDRSSLFQLTRGKPETLELTHLHQSKGDATPPERMNLKDFWPWGLLKILKGETLVISRMEDLPPDAVRDRDSFIRYGTKAMVGVPLSVGGGAVFGLLSFALVEEEREWPESVVQQFELVAQIFANALARKQAEHALREQLDEIRRLKQRLEQENIYLRDEIRLRSGPTEIVGRSTAMKAVLAQVEQVAGTDATVLLSGETGTGKELLARTIHELSSRRERSLVAINCAVLPPTLIESELFGREKGAYTGALTRMAGRFEVADRSTLFLDEVGELPFDLQAKLLRVIEEGQFERLGSTRSLKVDVRIIAATNRDLAQEVAAGRFRKDLFYRLSVFPIAIPPLRERTEDIPPLVWMFVKQIQNKLNKRIDRIPSQSLKSLMRYPWPGNAREMRNTIEHAMILCGGSTLHLHPPKPLAGDRSATGTLEEVERRHIRETLERTGWRITGPGGAAELLGLKRTTLQSKMKKLGLHRPTD